MSTTKFSFSQYGISEVISYNFNKKGDKFILVSQTGELVVFDSHPIKVKFRTLISKFKNLMFAELVGDSDCIVIVSKDPKSLTNIQTFYYENDGEKIPISIYVDYQVISMMADENYIYVLSDKHVYIYALRTLDLVKKHQTREISGNSDVFALTKNNIYAYPGKLVGSIVVDSIGEDGPQISISAHDNDIAKIALNNSGEILATTSEAGTLVRIFNTSNGNRLHEFRRGSSQCKIHSMCFDKNSDFLALSSDSGTLHIFFLKKENERSFFSFISGISDYFSSEWSSISYEITRDRNKIFCHGGEKIFILTSREMTILDISKDIKTKTKK